MLAMVCGSGIRFQSISVYFPIEYNYVTTWDTLLRIIKYNNYISRLNQYPFVGHEKIMTQKQRIACIIKSNVSKHFTLAVLQFQYDKS